MIPFLVFFNTIILSIRLFKKISESYHCEPQSQLTIEMHCVLETGWAEIWDSFWPCSQRLFHSVIDGSIRIMSKSKSDTA